MKLTGAFLGKKPWPTQNAEPAAVIGPTVSETVEGLTTRSFLLQSCTKTVPPFMSKLPELWSKQSSPTIRDLQKEGGVDGDLFEKSLLL